MTELTLVHDGEYFLETVRLLWKAISHPKNIIKLYSDLSLYEKFAQKKKMILLQVNYCKLILTLFSSTINYFKLKIYKVFCQDMKHKIKYFFKIRNIRKMNINLLI